MDEAVGEGRMLSERLDCGNAINLLGYCVLIDNLIYFRKSKNFFDLNTPWKRFKYEFMVQDQRFTMFLKMGNPA
jgi:hypothetical protein